MTICGSFEIFSYKLFYMVIQTCNSLFKASLEEKNEKQKKEGWLAGDIFFNFRLSSLLRFHENSPVFFCIFDIFNNHGLKSGQNNTGEAVLSRSRS